MKHCMRSWLPAHWVSPTGPAGWDDADSTTQVGGVADRVSGRPAAMGQELEEKVAVGALGAIMRIGGR
jgi:hypothetical protein